MNKKYYKSVDETVYYEKLENGLDVYLIPKNDYNKVYATFLTKYGSINTSFICNGKRFDQPKGIAHYLEHKMFDMPDGVDVFDRLSKLGAQSNAFTSYSQTCYLFSSTSNVLECINELLDFVQTPYFTDETVEKERGIIEQEIKMYDDYPDVILDRGLTKNLYLKTPYKDDIAGTVDDIAQIKASDLYDAYNAFYNPSNMIMTVIGNFNPEEMLDCIKLNQSKKKFDKINELKLIYEEEPMHINLPFEEKKIGLGIPKLELGVKLPVRKNILKSEMELLLFTELLLGETSDNYEGLIKKKLINESFGVNYTVNDSIRCIIASGDTTNPKELYKELIKIFNEKPRFDLNKFNLEKKAILGEFITVFNSLEATSRLFTKYNINNESFFDIIDIINEISIDDLNNIFDEIRNDLISCYIVY